MAPQTRRGRHRLRVTALSVVLGVAAALPGHAPASSAATGSSEAAPAAPGPYVTLLFSRTEMTAADNCVTNNAGVARLDTTVAPYLTSLGLRATGTLVTDRTKANALTCVHDMSSMSASWAQATSLSTTHGWRFVSHTATYPSNLAALTPTQARAETCGSAQAIEAHGLPGARGLIAYPGFQQSPTQLHTQYGDGCFAWGRTYGSAGTTAMSAGTTAPHWQNTVSVNGGACNVATAPCYTIASVGNPRYQLPSRFAAYLAALEPGEWFTLQAYVLVTGRSPAYSTSPIRWDCTSTNVRRHWTNDNERYCYQDWQEVVRMVRAVPAVTVTDPLTVGVAFGRPATYP
jgi:hypothetical protein